MESKIGENKANQHNVNRLPSIHDIEKLKTNELSLDNFKMSVNISRLCLNKKPNYILFNNVGFKEDLTRRGCKEYNCYSLCFVSVCISFILGLVIGIVLTGCSQTLTNPVRYRKLPKNYSSDITRTLNSIKDNNLNDNAKKYSQVSFTGNTYKYNKDVYPKSLTEDMKDILKDNKVNHKHKIDINKTFVPVDKTVLYDNVFWGPQIENSMPQGYGQDTAVIWEKFVDQSEVVKMEAGCGRMQNRLVTFNDGVQACVRYRQNTDQIQGEIFSFYVARLLNLTNLAPSVVKVVDLKDKLWKNVASDIAAAQWNSNRAVILTQYIPSLESANIPDVFKPSNRHLNKNDVYKITFKENEENSKQVLIDKIKIKNTKLKTDEIEYFDHVEAVLNRKIKDLFVELAQWSDLIIFDYLTANLDRIVNNLFNYQWNINIMDGPAHNLARKMDSGLLLFLDNESGLLHGYRLLKKYNVYHSLMLDNLCMFRKTTVDALKHLYVTQSVAPKLSDLFHMKNNAVIRDILPPLPEKNAKVLHERIGKVLAQIDKCILSFGSK